MSLQDGRDPSVPSQQSSPPTTSHIIHAPPHLQEPIQMPNDTTMRDTTDMIAEVDARLNFDTSEDDAYDSMTDESSVDEDRVVPHGLPVSTLPTGLCYDERMRYHSEVSAPTGDSVHPEDPRRIYYIYRELCEAGLVAEVKGFEPIITLPLHRIDAREATKEEICLVHTSEHYDFVKRTSLMSDEELIDLSESGLLDSIYFNALSYYAGKLSAGGSIETCRAVMQRQVKNAIAVVRPPGHHAEVQCTMGFCLFNNVCIASRVCQRDFGEACRKILILDWDVHHGNGCQKAFYDDPNILYISIHVHQNGQFYPSGPEGDMYHCGEGVGVGKNINIPWKSKGMSDGDYMYAFQHVVMPIATEFDPDLVIVAAGFDAAAGDELGGCFVSPACYAHMTHMLMSLANGKIAVCLEGGYNFQAISKSALAVTRTLMGEPPDRLEATQATNSAIDVVQKVRQLQSRYWKSIYPKDPSHGQVGGERLHDIIREWQAMHLYDKYRLTELHILRDSISRSFKQQVLASPEYESQSNLLLLFHDPPDLMSPHNPLTTKRKPHETWMLDATQSYIKRAVNLGIAVVDINIPEHITIPSLESNYSFSPTTSTTQPPRASYLTASYSDPSSDLARKESEKLALYLWENYIEPYDFMHIFILGAGNAFHTVAKLISENDSIYKSITRVISFISENPVRHVTNPNNPWIGQWYRDNSKIYVAHDHGCWSRPEGKKMSRRYGRLVRAPEGVKGLNEMMAVYEDEVFEFIKEAAGLENVDDDDDVEGSDTEDENEMDGEEKRKVEEDDSNPALSLQRESGVVNGTADSGRENMGLAPNGQVGGDSSFVAAAVASSNDLVDDVSMT